MLAGERPFYLLLHDESEPIAAAVFWLRRSPAIPDVPEWAAGLIGAILRRRPLLLCEIPLADVAGLALPAEVRQRREALAAICSHALELASTHGASFVVFGYLEEADALALPWDPAFRHIKLHPGTAIDLAGVNSYEQLLGQMTKKRRKNLRRAREAVEAQGVQISRRTEVDPELAVRLADNVARRHHGRPPPEIRAMVQHAPLVDACCLVAEQYGRIVGLDFLVGDRGVWKVKFTGSDYSVGQLYFLLSEEDLRFAVEAGALQLQAGTHLYEVKQRFGYRVLTDGHVRFAGAGRGSAWLARLIRGNRA